MHMKNHLYRILSCALLLLASTTSVLAENGIRETLYYTICPGETIRLESERVVVITKSTILYDTMHVTNPNEDGALMYESASSFIVASIVQPWLRSPPRFAIVPPSSTTMFWYGPFRPDVVVRPSMSKSAPSRMVRSSSVVALGYASVLALM